MCRKWFACEIVISGSGDERSIEAARGRGIMWGYFARVLSQRGGTGLNDYRQNIFTASRYSRCSS